MKRTKVNLILFILIFTIINVPAQEVPDPFEMVDNMGKGINLGNVLEAPTEGAWVAPAKEFYFDDYKKAGFDHVRIPVRWNQHTDTTSPYQIDQEWLNRVEEVANWGLEKDMKVIINSHHDDWLIGKNTAGYAAQIERLDSIWAQVSRKFSDRSTDLVFEIYNEPRDEYGGITSSQLDSLNQRIVNTIREENPNKYIIFGGMMWNSYDKLINEVRIPEDPENDPPHLIGTFHNYNPFDFAHEANVKTWGTESDKREVRDYFDDIKYWSDTSGIPVYMGEYGATSKAERESVLEWYEFNVKEAHKRNFSTAAWEDAGEFGPYYRSKNNWDIAKLNRIMDQGNYKNKDLSIPGLIQAEDFDTGGHSISYADADNENTLGYYRIDSGVEIDSLEEDNYAVVLSGKEEWTEYTFEVDSSGEYEVKIAARVPEFSSTNSTGLKLDFNGIKSTDSIIVQNTENIEYYTDSLKFETGVNQMRVKTAYPGLVIDQIEFDLVTAESEDKNLVSNPGFESGTQNWNGNSCSIEAIGDNVHSGDYALHVTDRSAAWAAPIQDVSEKVKDKGPGEYKVSSYMKFEGDIDDTAKATVALNFSPDSTEWLSLKKEVNSNDWIKISGNLSVDWDTPPESIDFYVETINSDNNFYTDDMLLQLDSSYTETGVEKESITENRIKLNNYPNPFNPSTTIEYNLKERGPAKLTIYNIKGQQVKTLVNSNQSRGRHTVQWKARNQAGEKVASGIYFYRLQQGSTVKTNKMLLVR